MGGKKKEEDIAQAGGAGAQQLSTCLACVKPWVRVSGLQHMCACVYTHVSVLTCAPPHPKASPFSLGISGFTSLRAKLLRSLDGMIISLFSF